MKRILSLMIAMFLPCLVWAAGAGSGPGCGMGAVAFKGQSGFVPHTSAATTNQSSFSQLSGISSGTSGCGDYEPIQVAAAFIRANKEQFAIDLSRGGGEVLDNYIALMGVDLQHHTEIKQYLKSNFERNYSPLSG